MSQLAKPIIFWLARVFRIQVDCRAPGTRVPSVARY